MRFGGQRGGGEAGAERACALSATRRPPPCPRAQTQKKMQKHEKRKERNGVFFQCCVWLGEIDGCVRSRRGGDGSNLWRERERSGGWME